MQRKLRLTQIDLQRTFYLKHFSVERKQRLTGFNAELLGRMIHIAKIARQLFAPGHCACQRFHRRKWSSQHAKVEREPCRSSAAEPSPPACAPRSRTQEVN